LALAFFITFSTNGTWLHGTSKGPGSVDDEHERFGTPFVAADPRRESVERYAMAQPPYELDAGRRTVVRDAIVALCAGKRWRLFALHVRSNHVHVVISAGREPGRLLSDMKARASRDLTRAGFDSAERIRWTRHGSTRHLFDPVSVEQKVRYTLDEQGERTAWFDARTESDGNRR
jgi:REP element-mobilizing transposase RayT